MYTFFQKFIVPRTSLKFSNPKIQNKKYRMPSEIKLYNTKSRTLEEFIPLVDGKVGIYSCGPTVYHFQHLGNMRAAVFADTLRRMFVMNGYTVGPQE